MAEESLAHLLVLAVHIFVVRHGGLLVCIISCGRRSPSICWVIGRSSHRLRARWLTYFVRWRLAFLLPRLDAAFDDLREWWLFFPVSYFVLEDGCLR